MIQEARIHLPPNKLLISHTQAGRTSVLLCLGWKWCTMYEGSLKLHLGGAIRVYYPNKENH